ncbi:MAG: hypothetical protein AM326_01620 [Candidatus Thorarchaeota archaeon SMTZ-45]|nr:MAG: hypothetical protein AM326_01620 [Candidatus Thorarchaeota archaeon SMTZ-45]
MTEKEVSHEEALEALGKKPKDKKKKKDRYKSQEGFIQVPVYRGFTAIQHIWPVIYDNGGVILGGYVRYMCSPILKPIPATDLDIYSPTKEIFAKLSEALKTKGCEMKSENDLAVLYQPFKKDHPLFPCPTVNLVKPMEEGVVVTQGEMDHILSNFDFTVVRIGLLTPGIALADADFLHDEAKKFLRIKNIHCPVSTIYRVMKYNRKGYWPSTTETIKVLIDWEDRDEEYKIKIMNFLQKEDPTQEEIDMMERLMRVFD